MTESTRSARNDCKNMIASVFTGADICLRAEKHVQTRGRAGIKPAPTKRKGRASCAGRNKPRLYVEIPPERLGAAVEQKLAVELFQF